MSGADQGSGKPKGWYGKAARAERQAAREAARAARNAGKAKPGDGVQAIRESAARRLARLPAPARTPALTVAEIRKREEKRVGAMLSRDRGEARRERLRIAATEEVEAGTTKRLQDTVIPPTPEQLRQAEYRPVLIEKLPGSVRTAETVRRVTTNRVKQLYDRGVLSDDTYPAVLWYQRQWEACGISTSASAAAWGEQVRGEPSYGLMPKTQAQAEARANFRFARGFIPGDMVATFDLVVLTELTISEAAQTARCRYTNAAKMVQAAALLLLGGIAHLLPVRAADGQEIAPADDVAFVTELEAGREVDPIMLDARGMFRPADELAAIARGRGLGLGDDAIVALLDEPSNTN
jgi:hypothetical protein